MLFLACLFACIGTVSAQTSRVTGAVVSADDGQPVIGASVTVKGEKIGTVTDMDGLFSIGNVPDGAKTLVVSFIGMKPKEVQIKPNMKITLESSSKLLNEVVVTALGIKRQEKALGYAATTVKSEDLTAARSTNLMQGLEGKVAGVQITAASSSAGGSNSVVVRGYSSLSGSNQPLYVVDGIPLTNTVTSEATTNKNIHSLDTSYDYGNGSNAVNPEDVASMTILKGAAATALYGNRAANGVIIITTKSGSKHKGYGVEYNGGLQWENVLRLPEFQNEFGMGPDGTKTLIENQSYGPKFDGSNQLWGTVYNHSQKYKKYVAIPNNVKDFFDTGFRYNNNVSFNGATDDSEYYVSLGQTSDDGIIPTNADKYDKYTFSTRGSYKMGGLKLSSSVNYTSQRSNNVAQGQKYTMMNSLYQIPRDISIVSMANLNDPFNTLGYYFTPYGVINPYWILKNDMNVYNSQMVYGKVQADYDFLKHFKLTYRLGLDDTNSQIKEGIANIAALMTSEMPNYGQVSRSNNGVYETTIHQRELNHDLMLQYNQTFGKYTINAVAGMNANDRKYYRLYSYVQNLTLPTWYNLSNSSNTPVVNEYNERRRIVGLYGQVELGYNDLLYLTGSARKDWSSTLPKAHRSFFYPGVTGSFIFTQLLPKDVKKIIDFGKLRLAWGQTGNDASPYMLDPYYEQASINTGFAKINFPLGGVNAFTVGNILGSNTLKPEITTESEVGAQLSLLNDRIYIDGDYYSRTSKNQIFSLDMDPATGYTAQNINLGKISNKGIELLLTVKPIVTKDFSWAVSWNFTKNNSKVVSLPPSLGGISEIEGLNGGIAMYAITGKPMGEFKSTIPQYTKDGKIVVNATTGLPVADPTQAVVGDMNYKYTMGFNTTLTYKGVSLAVDVDVRHGGLMYSSTKSITYFTGVAKQTAYNDREPFVVKNSVNAVTNSDGSTSYVENATAISGGNLTTYWTNGGDQLDRAWLISRSFVKLRDVILSWDIPASWVHRTPLQSVKISAFGSNLFLWTPKNNTFIDPESSTFGNDLSGNFGEFYANPSCRKFGVNLTVKF